MKKEECSIIIPDDIASIPEVNAFVESQASRAGLSASAAGEIKLAVEEAVANVINYAFHARGQNRISVVSKINKDFVEFNIIDEGIEFDPTIAPEADISLTAEERMPGGLGILMIRNCVDFMHYARNKGKNILTLRKNI